MARKLIQELARHDSHWSAPADGDPLTLRKNALGRPYLLLGDKEGPSLSFSHGAGRLWAAMGGNGRVGIDFARPEEFSGDYPLARAFGPQELDSARALFPHDKTRGTALLWSLKEASVKAIGSGFNLFDPLDVCVSIPRNTTVGFSFEVLVGGRAIPAWSLEKAGCWLSVAWM